MTRSGDGLATMWAEVNMTRPLRVGASVAVAGAFVALFTATSVWEPSWVRADRDERWILVPLDDEGVHEGFLDVVVVPPAPRIVAEGEPQADVGWVERFEMRIELGNPNARPSLDLVDGWTQERQRIVDGVLVEHPLSSCDPLVGCVVRVPLRFDGRHGRADAVFVQTELGAWIFEDADIDPGSMPTMHVDWVPEATPADLAEGAPGDAG